MDEQNGIRNQIDTFLTKDSGQHTHTFNEGLLTQNKRYCKQINTQFLQSLKWDTAIDAIKSADLRRMERVLLEPTDPYRGTVEEMHPLALVKWS